MDKAYYREMWEEAREELKLVDEENKDLRAENARLKAEVERLSKPAVIGGYNISEYIRMANSETLEFDNGDIFADMTLPERIKYIVESHANLKAEVERLRASSFVTAVPVEQYERLRKAGDAMVQLLDHMDVVMDMDSDHPEVEAWNAAKGSGNTK